MQFNSATSLFKSVITLTILISIFGCGEPKTINSNERRFDDGSAMCSAEYKENSCAFGGYPDGFNSGGDAVTGASSEHISKTFFNKSYDENRMVKIRYASPRLTVTEMEAAGVQVFQNGELCGCAIFRGLPLSDNKLANYWFDISGGKSKSTLLGLYLPKTKVAALGSQVNGAAILIRGDTDRWTLVHEYMHHLFNQQRNAEGIGDDDIQIEYKRAASDLMSLATTATPSVMSTEEKNQIEKRFVLDIQGLKMFLVNFPLEEITVEAHLTQLHRQSELKYVPPKARIVAANYICAKYQETLAIHDRIAQTAKIVVKKLQFQDYDVSKLQEEMAQLKAVVDEASALNKDFGLAERCKSGSRNSLQIFSMMKSCGHDLH